MNKRIEQLIEQADDFEILPDAVFCDTDFLADIDPRRVKKFAELIVKMCADYADMAQDAGCEYAGDYVAEAMGYGEEEGITTWRTK